MKTAILFDIDGTLTQTNALDGYWYVRALQESLDSAAIDDDWTHYPHVTDQGCTITIFERLKGRAPTQAEMDTVRCRFVELLSSDLASDPSRCSPVPRSVEMLSYLNGHTDYIVCLATGAWRDSAVVKLQHAGFAHLNLPMVSSSDAVSREDILSLAIERTKASVVDQGINPIISVGDAVWDVWAARRLGLRFIGVGEGERAARLLLEGAPHVIPDYRDRRQFLDLLATAAPVA